MKINLGPLKQDTIISKATQRYSVSTYCFIVAHNTVTRINHDVQHR